MENEGKGQENSAEKEEKGVLNMVGLLDRALPEALGVLLIGANSSALFFLINIFSLNFTKTPRPFRNAGRSEKFFLFAVAFNGLGKFHQRQ